MKNKEINHVLDEHGRVRIFKPWQGDVFSFFYDRIMEKSVFPMMFKADMKKHHEILERESGGIHHASI